MKKSERGFTKRDTVILILLFVVFAAGTFVFFQLKIAKSISKDQAFNRLHDAYAAAKTKGGCTSSRDCLSYVSVPEKYSIARAYGVTTDPKDTIYLDIRRGASLDVGGIGTAYDNNRTLLGINGSDWYWEIGACSTNNRIYINAESGQTAGVHSHVYCGGIE